MIGSSAMPRIGLAKACSSGSVFVTPRRPSSTSPPSTSPALKHPMRCCDSGSRLLRLARRRRPAHRSAKSCANFRARQRGGSRGSSENKSVPVADDAAHVSAAEAKALFAPLARHPAVVLAVSGGPDSTALLLLMARWRRALKRGTILLEVLIDHGVRLTAAAEARAVKSLARRLAVPHRTMRWEGKKPASGLQQAARHARYRLLADAARSAKASAIITAHTLDDQAETVLLRLSRGSGLTGLSAMARESPLPGNGVVLVRPLLDIPKARLIAMLTRVKIRFADDPSNRDPRFTRVRLRELMPALAHEGLSARSLWRLAGRLRRADAAIETAGVEAMEKLCGSSPDHARIVVDAEELFRLPAEVALRLLWRGIALDGAQWQNR